MDNDLVSGFRSRNVDVVTPLDTGLIGKSDEEQLTFASERGFVL